MTTSLFDLASKAENPDSIYPVLEQWLDDVNNNNDKILLAANYIDSVADQDTVSEGVKPQGQSKISSRQTASSMSSKHKHDFFMAKLRREEAEKQEQAAMRLAKQKPEVAMRKKELEMQMEQMALQDHRQRVAATKLDAAELMDNHSSLKSSWNSFSVHTARSCNLLPSKKRFIVNISRLNCSNHSVIKGVEQAHSPSRRGKMNPVNQVPVDVQNVALPPLQPPMQPPRPPTPVMAPTNSIVHDFSIFQQTHR